MDIPGAPRGIIPIRSSGGLRLQVSPGYAPRDLLYLPVLILGLLLLGPLAFVLAPLMWALFWPVIEVKQGHLSARTALFAALQRWPVSEVRAIYARDGVVLIRTDAGDEAVSPPLRPEAAAWVVTELDQALRGATAPSGVQKSRRPAPEIVGTPSYVEEGQDQISLPYKLPWTVVPAALVAMNGLWQLADLQPIGLSMIALGVFLVAASPALRSRIELQLQDRRLYFRRGWLKRTECSWSIDELDDLRPSPRGLVLVVRGREEQLPQVPPDAARWLLTRFMEARLGADLEERP